MQEDNLIGYFISYDDVPVKDDRPECCKVNWPVHFAKVKDCMEKKKDLKSITDKEERRITKAEISNVMNFHKNVKKIYKKIFCDSCKIVVEKCLHVENQIQNEM